MTKKDARDEIVRGFRTVAKVEVGAFLHPEKWLNREGLEKKIPHYVDLMIKKKISTRMIYAGIRSYFQRGYDPREEVDLSARIGLDGHTRVSDRTKTMGYAVDELAVKLAKQYLPKTTVKTVIEKVEYK